MLTWIWPHVVGKIVFYFALIIVLFDAYELTLGRGDFLKIVFISLEYLKTIALILYVPLMTRDPYIKKYFDILCSPILCDFFDFQSTKTSCTLS